MKKTLLLITMALCAIIMSASKNVSLLTYDGRVISGKLTSITDTSAIFFVNQANVNITFPASKIINISDKNGVIVENRNGKLVVIEPAPSAEAPITKAQSDPNNVIGNAFKKTGTASLAIGVPCLAAGLATCIAGKVGSYKYNMLEKAQCTEASYYLLGIGASLTIVGIPLYVEGKKISELKINYTGNGVGASITL